MRRLLILRGNDCVCVSGQNGAAVTCVQLTRRYNDDNKEDDDADNETHAHLHVLPPHLLAHAVGAPPESLGGHGEIVGLVLERI